MNYKIIYSNIMYGGNAPDNTFPDYPDSLGISRGSEWPPDLDHKIIIKESQFGMNFSISYFID